MPEDIAVCVAKRCIGQLSAALLNAEIQKLFDRTGASLTKNYTDNGYKYTVNYYVGDRVLVTKNNYSAQTIDGAKEAVFNGNLGTVIDVDTDEGQLIVRFPQGDIIIYESELENLQLGYAITTHKVQGSGFRYVIAIADPAAYLLLTKEFLYTEVTRAKEHCYLIGTQRSISTCIRTTRVIKKQTWLCELLLKYAA